jgi:hypothetical protein
MNIKSSRSSFLSLGLLPSPVMSAAAGGRLDAAAPATGLRKGTQAFSHGLDDVTLSPRVEGCIP